MPKTIWDIEGATDLAVQLRKDGLSASRIADTLTVKYNFNVTRNTIIGKLSRMGLAGLVKVGAPHHQRKKAPPGSMWFAGPSRPPQKSKPPRTALEMAPEPLPESRPDDIARISFAELDDNLCHWIPGDPSDGDPLHSKKYCGLPIAMLGPVRPPSPYCLEHIQRAFQPPTLRRTPSPFRPYVPASKIKEDA